MNKLYRQIGKFKIDDDDIKNHPDIVRRILFHTIIVRAEYMFYSNQIEYVAYSKKFDKVPIGEEPPEYDIQVNGFKVMFIKKDIR